jgi:replicative DNA helicase
MSVQTEVSLQKLPPQNIEAEQMVLGAILIENDSINKVVETLSPDDFYKDNHRRIFSMMLDMFETGEAIDLITLTDALRGKVGLESVGGASYLAYLVSLVPTAANIKNHARIVREKAFFVSSYILPPTSSRRATTILEPLRISMNFDRAERSFSRCPEQDQDLCPLKKSSVTVLRSSNGSNVKMVTGLPTVL